MTKQIAELEVKRAGLHDYVQMKLEERDYHGVADAAMDLRELEVRVNMLKGMEGLIAAGVNRELSKTDGDS